MHVDPGHTRGRYHACLPANPRTERRAPQSPLQDRDPGHAPHHPTTAAPASVCTQTRSLRHTTSAQRASSFIHPRRHVRHSLTGHCLKLPGSRIPNEPPGSPADVSARPRGMSSFGCSSPAAAVIVANPGARGDSARLRGVSAAASQPGPVVPPPGYLRLAHPGGLCSKLWPRRASRWPLSPARRLAASDLMLHLVLAAPPARQRRPLTAAISVLAAPAMATGRLTAAPREQPLQRSPR